MKRLKPKILRAQLIILLKIQKKCERQLINRLTNKKSKTTNITKIVVDDKVIEEREFIVNTFNNIFNEIGTNRAQKLPESTRTPESYIKPENDSTLELQNVTEVKVFGIVSALSSSKATGHDRISPKL